MTETVFYFVKILCYSCFTKVPSLPTKLRMVNTHTSNKETYDTVISKPAKDSPGPCI